MSLILIADDEPALLESLVDLVGTMGHGCIAASDGDQAFELAKSNKPDLIISDYMMPGKTGSELLRAIRADPDLSRVPVILITAATNVHGTEGAWHTLTKPLNLLSFEAAIKEALSSPGHAPTKDESLSNGHSHPDLAGLRLAREDMLNWVSHEIKSPLSAAMVSSHLLKRDLEKLPGSENLVSRVEKGIVQLQRINDLVTSILDAASLESGKVSLSKKVQDARDLLLTVASAWREAYPSYEFATQLPSTSVTIEADEVRLRQILDNLVSNAVKHGQQSKLIHLELSATHKQVEFRVIDHGPGIAAEQLPHIFKKFHRVTGAAGAGHGLGLYICSALARLHGGRLTVQSEVGNGTTFILALPR